MTIYEKVKALTPILTIIYKSGYTSVYFLLRDIELYKDYLVLDWPKMERYTHLSEEYGISESRVRAIIKLFSKEVKEEIHHDPAGAYLPNHYKAG